MLHIIQKEISLVYLKKKACIFLDRKNEVWILFTHEEFFLLRIFKIVIITKPIFEIYKNFIINITQI